MKCITQISSRAISLLTRAKVSHTLHRQPHLTTKPSHNSHQGTGLLYLPSQTQISPKTTPLAPSSWTFIPTPNPAGVQTLNPARVETHAVNAHANAQSVIQSLSPQTKPSSQKISKPNTADQYDQPDDLQRSTLIGFSRARMRRRRRKVSGEMGIGVRRRWEW